MPTYPPMALPYRVNPAELARADGPNVVDRTASDLEVLEAAVTVRHNRSTAGHTVTGTLDDLVSELLTIRANFSTPAVPFSPAEAYEMVLDGETSEDAHRCHGESGVSLDRISAHQTLYWIVYDIDPDGEPCPSVFADEAAARLAYHQRAEALRVRYGHLRRCCA